MSKKHDEEEIKVHGRSGGPRVVARDRRFTPLQLLRRRACPSSLQTRVTHFQSSARVRLFMSYSS